MELAQKQLAVETQVALSTGVCVGLVTLAAIAAIRGLADPAGLTALAGGAGFAAGLTAFCVTRWQVTRELQTLHQLAAAIDDVVVDGSPLYRNLPDRGPREIERIVAAWNGFALRFDLLMHNLRTCTSALNERTQEMAAIGPHAARRAQQQANALRQLVTNVRLLTGIPTAPAQSCSRPPDHSPATNATPPACDPQTAALEIEATMCLLQHGSQISHEAMLAIDELAFEINALAVDAAIAAADAGVHGEGFAAVAEAVQKMARQSGEAARSNQAVLLQAAEAAERGRGLATTLRAGMQGLSKQPQQVQTNPSRSGGQSHPGDRHTQNVVIAVSEKLLAEACTVAQRTGELVDAATEAAKAAAAIEACIWPPPEVDDRDIVRIGEASRRRRPFG